MNKCTFCSLDVIREREICGNDLAWAFPTNIPITPGHTLVSPRRCVASLEQLSDSERLAILKLSERIMSSLTKVYGAEGFNCAWNQGTLAGQSVPHFHLHIIPRMKDDTGLLGYDPRSMLYRTGDREPMKEEDLLYVRDKIKNIIDSIC